MWAGISDELVETRTETVMKHTTLRLQEFANLRSDHQPGRVGLRGARNPNARCRPWVVVLIREMHAAGWPYSALASAFGLSKTGIARICRREVWRE